LLKSLSLREARRHEFGEPGPFEKLVTSMSSLLMKSMSRGPGSATQALAEVAEDLLWHVLAAHTEEKPISLLAVAVSNLEQHPLVRLEQPLGSEDEARRPGTTKDSRQSRDN
jgi:hypothetical protein